MDSKFILWKNKDLIYLKGALLPLIEDILNAQICEIELNNLSEEDMYEQLKIISEETSKYLIRGSTFTDDFLGYKFKSGDEISIIWKMIKPDETPFEDLKGYTTSVVLKTLNYNVGKAVLDGLENALKK